MNICGIPEGRDGSRRRGKSSKDPIQATFFQFNSNFLFRGSVIVFG